MILNPYKRTLFFLKVLIQAPYLYLRIFLRKMARSKEDGLRIVVLPQLTRVGDLVCATPVFREIKKCYPKSHLAVISTNKVAGIIKNNPHIDQIIIYNSNFLAQFIREIRDGRFDWSFSLSGTSFGNMIFFLALVLKRAKITREDRPKSEVVSDWMNSKKLLYKHHTFLPQRYLDLLQYINIRAVRGKSEVFTSVETERQAAVVWENYSLENFEEIVGISITAGNKIKEWGDEKFIELAKKIVETYPHSAVIFLGAKGDEKRIDSLMRLLGEGPFFKAVDFSLEALPSLIKRLNLYIGVDTGPIYIAHALEVPLVDITGPVDPWEQPPHDRRSICVMPPAPFIPSSFVFKSTGKKDQHINSLARITVPMVMSVVEELL